MLRSKLEGAPGPPLSEALTTSRRRRAVFHMPAEESNHRNLKVTWRTAGLWIVILALGLAVFGIILALQQAQSLSNDLLAQAELRARSIAVTARELFLQRLDAALGLVANDMRMAVEEVWEPQVPLPSWIDGLYYWDGTELVTLAPAARAPGGFTAFLRARLSARPADHSSTGMDHYTQLVYDHLGDRPIILGYFATTDLRSRPAIVAARIHHEQLARLLVEPLLAAHSGLTLVSAGEATGPWTQPLSGPLQSWSLQPTASFVREHRYIIIGRTVAYLGLTVVALGVLLAGMWFLIRVVRREIALAQMKANFVADVSHELKTPLAAIQLFCETLQSGRVTSEAKRQEYYSIIIRESARLTSMINNILDFSRIESGRADDALQPIDVGRVVRETYDAFRVELDDKEFEHELSIAEGLPSVRADRDAISQAVLNLMSNAVKYSDEDRFVEVEVRHDTRRGRHGVLISVHDRGIGIQPEDRAHLFEGFFRSPDDRVRQRTGTGLGLALVKHIVDAHGGSLDVESRLVKGSTFRVFLPASEGEPASGVQPIKESETIG